MLYVSDYLNENILEFPASPRSHNPKPVATISLGVQPNGLWVDRHGVLYVAAGQSVLEFEPGATSPFLTITDGITGAEGVAVDAAGTLYVSNHSGQSVNVVEYPAGSSAPSLTLTLSEPDSLFGFPGGLTFDAAGNLYVATFFYPESNGRVFRFAPGQTSGTDLGLSLVGSQGGLARDAQGNLYVGDAGVIEVYRSGATQPFEAVGVQSDYPSFFAFTRSGEIYEPVTAGIPSKSAVLEFAPNKTKAQNSIVGDFYTPVGAALQAMAF